MRAPFELLGWRGIVDPFGFLEGWGIVDTIKFLGWWGIVDPIGFLGRWGIVDPIGFLHEGGTFSLECPRATAVFGQTVMVWGGGVLLNHQWSFLSDLSMMWGGSTNPAPGKLRISHMRGGGMLTPEHHWGGGGFANPAPSKPLYRLHLRGGVY